MNINELAQIYQTAKIDIEDYKEELKRVGDTSERSMSLTITTIGQQWGKEYSFDRHFDVIFKYDCNVLLIVEEKASGKKWHYFPVDKITNITFDY